MARQLTPNHASNLPSTRRDWRSYCTVQPSVRTRDLDWFTNVLRHVVRMRTRQVPHRQASTPRPPHVMFLTRPSPRLAIFIACYVARAGEGLGTRLLWKYSKKSSLLGNTGTSPFNPLPATLTNIGGTKAKAITELTKHLNSSSSL